MDKKTICPFEKIDEENKLLDPIHFEKIEEEFVFDPKPSKVFDISPFTAKQVEYLRDLVDSDNATDEQFRDDILSVLEGFLEGFAYQNQNDDE